MSTYVVLGKLTKEGLQDVKGMLKREEARVRGAEALGITIRESFL